MRENYSAESERAVLGALLLDNESIDRINLSVEDFYLGRHRSTFAAITSLLVAGQHADAVTVFEHMRQRGHEDKDLLPFLSSLAAETPSAAGVTRYATVVKDLSVGRGIERILTESVEALGTRQPVRDILDHVQTAIEALAGCTQAGGPVFLDDLLSKVAADLQSRADGGFVGFLPTGFARLDDLLGGGLRRQNLIVLAGRPSMGKTSMALNIARNLGKSHSTLIFSMEMGDAELTERVLAGEASVYSHLMHRPQHFSDEVWPRLSAALERLGGMSIAVDAGPAQTALDIMLKAKAHKRRHGLDLIIVDYLGLMSGGEGETRAQQVGSYSRSLKAIAKTLDVAVLALAQLNRDNERRIDKRPMLADLRDSGEIEQDADVAMFVHRPEVYQPDDIALRGYAEVLVRKQRNGPIGEVPLHFDAAFTRFSSFTGSKPMVEAKKAERSVF